MSLPVGQPRFWVENRRTRDSIGVWYRADTIDEAYNLMEFFNELGNRCVRIHGWVGLMYAPFEGSEHQVKEPIQLMAIPFKE